MSLNMTPWKATRRSFLKVLALIGTASSIDFLGPFKKIGFAKEGDLSLEEMRDKSIQIFKKRFH
jgi:hypothetical protein